MSADPAVAARADYRHEPSARASQDASDHTAYSVRRDFESIMSDLRSDLHRYALWLTRDASVAEDAVQEALIRGWRSWGELRDEQAIKPWFLTIVRRECARMYARKRVETRDLDSLCGAEQAQIATRDDAQLAEVRAAIFRLEPPYREPLVLQVLMGCSSNEIADTMGIKRGAVLTRLFRARQKLIRKLGGEQLDGGANGELD